MSFIAGLVSLYERLATAGEDVSAPGLAQIGVSARLVIDAKGRFIALDSACEGEGSKQRAARMVMPDIYVGANGAICQRRTSQTAARLAYDKADYLLAEPGSAEAAVFEAGLAVLKGQLASPHAGLDALAAFRADAAAIEQARKALATLSAPSQAGAIAVYLKGEGQPIALAREVREVVARLAVPNASAVARVHPPIKGVAGTQSAGAALVAVNFASGESWGKTKGEVAGVTVLDAHRYAAALNWLLRKRDQHWRCGERTVVWWADEGASIVSALLPLLENSADPSENARAVRAIYTAAQTGGVPVTDDALMHVLALRGAQGRIAVERYLVVSTRTLATRLVDWFEALGHPFAARTLARAAQRDERPDWDEVDRLAAQAALAALEGDGVPRPLVVGVVSRLDVGDEISDARHALLRAAVRRAHTEGEAMNATREQIEGIARTIVAVEQIIEAVNRERTLPVMIRSILAAPSTSLGRLVDTAEPYLQRLRRDKPGLAVVLRRRLDEGLALGRPFPPHLSFAERTEAWAAIAEARNAAYAKRERGSDDTAPSEALAT